MRKTNKKLKVTIFLLLVLSITIAYAALSSNLNINGSTSLNNATWSIIWDNVEVSTGSVKGTSVVQAAQITNTQKTLVEYSIILSKPGDYYEFTVDAKNEGSIDAMVDVISNKTYESNGTTEKPLPSYLNYTVTYSDGVEIAPNHLLESGKTEKYKVRVEYKKDIEASELPTEAETIKFKFSVTYIQADNTATNKPSSYVYTVNKYDSSVTTPKYNAVWLNQAFPTSITQYNTPSDALTAIATASSKDLPFYLKHKIENGTVTESYVEFVVTDAMASANPGMVEGTYTLRGEKTFDIDTSTYLVDESYISPYYEANKEAIKTAFGYSTNSSRCSESGTGRSSSFYCSVSGLGAGAYAASSVYSSRSSSYCYVYRDGYSYCTW